MGTSEFVYDSVDILHYKPHRISLNRSGSYRYSPEWLKYKKATINPKTNDDDCFQYAITVALNHEQINNNPEILSKIKPFIGKYNWKDIEFPSNKKDWKKIESNNESIAIKVSHNSEEIRHAYQSKHNLSCENQVILLMIT